MTIKNLTTYTSFGLVLFYHDGVKIGMAQPQFTGFADNKKYVFTGWTPECSTFECPWNGAELFSLDACENLALAWANEQERQGYL